MKENYDTCIMENNKEHNITESYNTKRATVEAIEDILYEPVKILDHGFIRVIDYMGNDTAIVQAARVSYGKGTKQVNQDKGLINYLMRNSHTTPFEMCEIKFHMKLPIFVARQWIRHRTASVNEYSARYSVLNKEFYIPSLENLGSQSKINKQCRNKDMLTPSEIDRILSILKQDASACYDNYLEMLNENAEGEKLDENKSGLARELARMNLSLNYYTEWYWKIDLHNLFHFLRLRADPHAQYEIRAYAEEMLKIVKQWVPLAYESFEEYKLHGKSLSRTGIEVIKRMINGEKVELSSTKMKQSEWDELMAILK